MRASKKEQREDTEKALRKARQAALEAPTMGPGGHGPPVDENPYRNGPYVVLSDGSTFDGAEGCAVVFVTDEGNEELLACSDFQAVEEDQMEMITLTDLMDAYNKVHGTDI